MDLNEIPKDATFDRHPWEIVRARFFTGVLRSVDDGFPKRLLDVGSGDAWLARRFLEAMPSLEITCVDPAYANTTTVTDGETDPIRLCTNTPDESFDVITLLDVLEHIKNDQQFLAEIVTRLGPGGYLVISVPAWPRLFSSHDVALEHYRRYRPATLAELLQAESLEILESGGLFHSLLPPRWATARVERVRASSLDPTAVPKHSLEWKGGQASRKAMELLLTADTSLARTAGRRGVQIPGLSTWALCRRAA
jgi:SAM-dependent methyltransferase